MSATCNNPGVDFINILKDWPALDYLYYLIAYQCAPVIEKTKPGVILNFTNNHLHKLNDLWRVGREQLSGSDAFCYRELRVASQRTTVLFYSPELLGAILAKRAVAQYLRDCGYREELTLRTTLTDLSRRFQKECPHEVGIFLGIPLADVLGFIANGGKNAVAEGYWKVYHDVPGRKALFARYHEAKLRLIRFVKAGNQPLAYLGVHVLALVK
ncbi:MAG: DUF3793 family protein [Bacillota bacterium]|jgi:hypothetical protein